MLHVLGINGALTVQSAPEPVSNPIKPSHGAVTFKANDIGDSTVPYLTPNVPHSGPQPRAIALLSAFAEDQLRPVAVTQTSPELTFA